MTNPIELKENWNEMKCKLKQRFANLTGNDLLTQMGRRDEILGRLQIKLGKTKEELNNVLNAL